MIRYSTTLAIDSNSSFSLPPTSAYTVYLYPDDKRNPCFAFHLGDDPEFYNIATNWISANVAEFSPQAIAENLARYFEVDAEDVLLTVNNKAVWPTC